MADLIPVTVQHKTKKKSQSENNNQVIMSLITATAKNCLLKFGLITGIIIILASQAFADKSAQNTVVTTNSSSDKNNADWS
ncbi:MAG TPA: hypothetical protein PKM20_09815, partial [Nitrosomonas sp.]|nr:hypothetical protein [Nitrosomonas sp.]